MERENIQEEDDSPEEGGDLQLTPAKERRSIEKLMANRNSEYWKGDKAEAHQARMRELIEADLKKAEPQYQNVDAEIAKIEKVMKENRARYDKSNGMQKKYRELLQQKHGGG
jgi:hypothetical protein